MSAVRLRIRVDGATEKEDHRDAARHSPAAQPGSATSQLPITIASISPHELLWLAAHSAMVDTGFRLTTAVQQEGGGASALFSHKLLQYQVQDAAGGAFCTVKRSSIGSHFILLGAVDGSNTAVHHVSLSVPDHVEEQQQQQGAAGAAGAAASGSGSSTGQFKDTDGVSGAASGADGPIASLVRLKQPQQLWLKLKNELALALLASAAAASGQPPLFGLLALPREVKERCLQGLKGPDLAAVLQTCRELRAVASTDSLWEACYEAEFGVPSSAVRNAARFNGWRAVFK
ncbi:hypothetical protein WJX72_005652 [[Myrmecia] bisecta]|uniref:F-box domain-containing protein n=1 Tax=[Myrmecia] bisecta TaxID=41462 RepID=A0AAW1PCY3_9CHLO